MTNRSLLHVVSSDGGDPAGRLPPHDLSAEQIVVGAAMLSPAALTDVRRILDGGEFFRPAHQTIWQTITTLADHGHPHEVTAVRAALGGAVSKVGGPPYLIDLIQAVPTTASAGYYAQRVRDLAYARKVIETGTRLVQLGHTPDAGDTADLRGAVAAEAAALTAADGHGWPEPTPLTAVPELPRFPLWALPDWLGDYAADLAEVTQTPADLAGCLGLAVLAVAAAGKIWVAAPAWREPTNLFIVVVLPPGNRKSEVYRAMTAPIRAAERVLINAAKPLIAEAVIRRRIAETNADKTAKAAEIAADGIDLDKKTAAFIDAAEAKRDLEDTTIPPEPCLFTDDATVEPLTTLVAEQGGRMALLSPEGEIFSIAAGRYSGAPNFGVLKKGHAGEEIRVNRTGRTEQIDAATVTLGICMQPGVLARLSEVPQFKEQGLLGRLLYAVPESLLGYRNPHPDPIPPEHETTYHTNTQTLTLSLAALPEPATLTFTPGANTAITQMLADTEPRFRPGEGDLAHMTDWGGKLVGATVRIAALLHLADHHRDGWNQPITTTTFQKAREIADYFTTHAQTAYDTIGADPATSDARAILEWATNTNTTRFTTRDLMRAHKRRFTKATHIEPAIRILETHGWIRRLPDPPRPATGRTPAPTYQLHPHTTP